MVKVKKRATQYNLPVFIEPCEEGGYFASCPSLPGCFVETKSVSQAVEYLEDAVSQFIQSYREHGDPLPAEVAALEVQKASHRYFPISLFLPVELAV